MAIELKVPSVGESITEVQIGEWLKDEGRPGREGRKPGRDRNRQGHGRTAAPRSAARLPRCSSSNGETAAGGRGDRLHGSKRRQRSRKSSADDEAAAAARRQAAQHHSTPKPKSAIAARRGPAPRRGQPPRPVPQPSDEVQPRAAQPPLPALRSQRPTARSGVARTCPLAPARHAVAPARRRGRTPHAAAAGEEEVVPMSPIRRRIAQRLVEAQHTAALLTTFNEIDMSAVMALRNEHSELFQETYGVKLGFMSFFVKAAIDALKLVPAINAEIRGNDIVYHNYYDIGIAVGGGKGLVVPVLRDAERMSFAEIERGHRRLRPAGPRQQPAARRAARRHVHHHQRRRLRLAALDADRQSAAKRHPRPARHPGPPRRPRRPGRDPSDDVRRPDLRPPHRRRPRRRDFLKRIKEVIEEPMRMLVEI